MSLHVCLSIILVSILGGCKNDTPGSPPVGPDWLVFTHQNTPPLLDNKINALTVESSGRVWFATNLGACAIFRGSWNIVIDSLSFPVFTQNGTITSHLVSAIAEGKDGSIWFGLNGGGVRRLNRTSSTIWQRYSANDLPRTISYDFISSITASQSQEGDVWISTVFGVSHFLPARGDPTYGTWEIVSSSHFLSSNVRAIAVNPIDNSVCFGSQSGAVFYDPNTDTWTTFEDVNNITGVAFDLRNTIWFSTWDGISSVNFSSGVRSRYTSQSTNHRIPEGHVNAVTTDLYSTRWFATEGGLVRLRDTTWTTFNSSNSPLPGDTVTAIAFDRNKNLWIGTTRGAAVFNEEGTRF